MESIIVVDESVMCKVTMTDSEFQKESLIELEPISNWESDHRPGISMDYGLDGTCGCRQVFTGLDWKMNRSFKLGTVSVE